MSLFCKAVVGCLALGSLILFSTVPTASAAGFTVLTQFPLTDSEVKTVVVDSAKGVVYIGGVFTTVGGQPRNSLAAINAATGALLPWNPGANGTVQSLLLSNGVLYVAGDFNQLNGVTRRGIGAFAAIADLTSSTPILTSFDPNATGGGVVCLAADGTHIYAGGFFSAIGTQSYQGLAKLDPTSGNAVVGWNPNPTGTPFSLALSGTSLYVGGSFSAVGGATRANLAAIDTSTALATSWNPAPNGTVNLVTAWGSRVYVGGQFDTVLALPRGHFVAFDPATGLLDAAFDPNADSSVATVAFTSTLAYVGGSFSMIGGETRKKLAALDLTTGFATGWNPGSDGDVQGLAVRAGTVFIGTYNNTKIGGVTRLPSFDFAAVTENGPDPVPPVTSAPSVKIKGKKVVSTTKASFKLKGTATVADGTIASVRVKVGKAKAKSAKGTSAWSFVVKLKPGKNVVTVTATGSNGRTSSPAKVTVVQK